jgi:transposase InsO family protein
VWFLFENIVTRFGCPIVLLSNHGTHFLSKTIATLTEEFYIHHRKSTPYHLQDNGTLEDFSIIYRRMKLTKVCNVGNDDCNLRIYAMLWDYSVYNLLMQLIITVILSLLQLFHTLTAYIRSLKEIQSHKQHRHKYYPRKPSRGRKPNNLL